MFRKTVSEIILTPLLIGMLTLVFNVQPAKSEPTTIIVPDDYPTIQEAINNANEGDTRAIYRLSKYTHNMLRSIADITIQFLARMRFNSLLTPSSS